MVPSEKASAVAEPFSHALLPFRFDRGRIGNTLLDHLALTFLRAYSCPFSG